MKSQTSLRISAAALKLLDNSHNAESVTMRRVASAAGLSPMAIYKHFPNREALLKAATSAEYERIGKYFKRANARKNVQGLRGMLGYLDYALEHPNLFLYMFSSVRKDAYAYPAELNAGESPTLHVLHCVVESLMQSKVLRTDKVSEVSLAIWAHAQGLIMLYFARRIELPKKQFRKLYLRSLNRLLDGLAN